MDTKKLQLPLQTSSLIAGFMVWVIISSLMPVIRKDIPLTDGQVSVVTAVPVILGSVLRVNLGFWTNRYGARLLFFVSFLVLIFPIFYISIADSFIDLIIGGLFLGIGGAVFSIGVTALPKYYPKEKHGFVNGIYGAGNIGTAITSFSAPALAASIGWVATVRLYIILVALFALLNFVFGDRKEEKAAVSFQEQFKAVYKDEKLWFLSLFYFVTFGSFVAFTVFLPSFLVSNFRLDSVDAGLRTAGFITLATVMRPIGGWLGDRFNPLIILMIVFAGLTFSGALLSFSPTIFLYSIGCLLVAFCAGIGNGAVFKLVPLYFSKYGGIVNGIVSAIGGLGGFFPPIVLSIVFGLTGHYAIGFMALSEFALASFVIVVWMYYMERLSFEKRIFDASPEGLFVTDEDGVIKKANRSFAELTGFSNETVVGNKPDFLKSGKHNERFYEQMWNSIKKEGFWKGEIFNKKENGDIERQQLTINKIDTGTAQYYLGALSSMPKENK